MNPRDIIDVAFAMDMWVFGGYVRDHVVRGEEFRDIDLCCSRGSKLDQFFRVLNTRFKVRKVHENISQYGMSPGMRKVFRCVVNDTISIDVVVFDGTFEDWRNEHSTDFTCNLFYQTRDVDLGLRFIPPMFRNEANPLRAIKEMTQKGIFYRLWDGTNHRHTYRVVDRASDLVNRGFTFRGKLVSDIMYLGLHGHSFYQTFVREEQKVIEQIQNERAYDTFAKSVTLPPNIKDQIRQILLPEDDPPVDP